MTADDLLTLVKDLEGLEVHVENTPALYIHALALRNEGKVTISPRRGPGQMWVRVEAVEDEI